MPTQTNKEALKIEGTYKLEGDYLTPLNSTGNTLKVCIRYKRLTKGQSKRYIGTVKKPHKAGNADNELFTYLSGLWPSKRLRNSYTLEYKGTYYKLAMINADTVEIKPEAKENALQFKPEGVLSNAPAF